MARIKVKHAGNNGEEKDADAAVPEEGPDELEEVQEAGVEQEVSAENEEAAEALPDDIDSLKEKARTLEDALKRERADFINYRQRIARELERMSQAARRQLVSEITDLVDAFHHTDRGLSSHQDFEGLKDAYVILRGHLDMLMDKWHIEITGVPGEPFDPVRHEAMMRVEDASVDGPVVREVIKPGFAMPDMVIRSAQVVVASPPAEPKAEEESASEKDDGGKK